MFLSSLKFLAIVVSANFIAAERSLGANEAVNDHIVNNITNLRGASNSINDGIASAATVGLLHDFPKVSFDLSRSTPEVDLENTNEMLTAAPSVGANVENILALVAGTGVKGYYGDGIAATMANLLYPTNAAIDGLGNVIIVDTYNYRIRKVALSTGVITTIAGTGSNGFNADRILATTAVLNSPLGVASDESGNIYIADSGNYRIRKVAITTGIITTIAGTGVRGYNADGIAATGAQLTDPNSVAIDVSGNVYIADTMDHRIRKVTVSTGIITTVAGTGAYGYNGDGIAATSAKIYRPFGVAVDCSCNIYIADMWNHRIRKVTVSTGIITTVAGTGTYGYNGDGGLATSALLFVPSTIAVDNSGYIYIADTYNHRIRKVTVSTGIITTVAGTGVGGYNGDVLVATSTPLNLPTGVVLDKLGNVYISDRENSLVRVLSSTMPTITPSAGAYVMKTLAGTGSNGVGGYSGDGMRASTAQLDLTFGVAVDATGNIFIADTTNHRIRKVTISTGIITTIAGTGTVGYSGDGSVATAAQLYDPTGVAVDLYGNVYIVDCDNNRIRKVTLSTGIITTVAGTGTVGYNGDGILATSARLSYPRGIAIDRSGNMYIADKDNHRIRKVTVSTGIITTVAGAGVMGYSGNGLAATSAQLNQPEGVAIDASGNIFIADTENHRIRKVTISTGIITTIAGTGTVGHNGDGITAISADLSYPHGVSIDGSGNIYIADTYNERIRKVTVSSGIITTIAGTGNWGFNGDGIVSTSTQIDGARGVVVDRFGNIYIADTTNCRIRVLVKQP